MKNICFIFLLISTLICCYVGKGLAADWNKAPECVLQAATDSLAGYLRKIPPEDAAMYGFSSAASLNQVMADPAFGFPLLLRTITPAALDSYTEKMTVASLLSDMKLWYVPVLVEQAAVAFLVVEQSDEFPCKAVSFGYANLAAEYEAVLANLSAAKRRKAVLVVVYQAGESFIAFPDDDPDNLYSLRMNGMQPKQGSNGSENSLQAVVSRLKPVVHQNLKQAKEWK